MVKIAVETIDVETAEFLNPVQTELQLRLKDGTFRVVDKYKEWELFRNIVTNMEVLGFHEKKALEEARLLKIAKAAIIEHEEEKKQIREQALAAAMEAEKVLAEKARAEKEAEKAVTTEVVQEPAPPAPQEVVAPAVEAPPPPAAELVVEAPVEVTVPEVPAPVVETAVPAEPAPVAEPVIPATEPVAEEVKKPE